VWTVLYYGDTIDCLSVQTRKHGTQNIQNDCHQWLSDSFRVHQIRFRPGLCPGPRWGSLQRSRRPLAGLGGLLLRGGETGEGERKGRERGEKGKGSKQGTGAPFTNSWIRNDLYCVEWGVKLYSLTHSGCTGVASVEYCEGPTMQSPPKDIYVAIGGERHYTVTGIALSVSASSPACPSFFPFPAFCGNFMVQLISRKICARFLSVVLKW